MIRFYYVKNILLILIVIFFSSCTTTQEVATVDDPGNALRVGVTPNYPPIIFKQGGEIAGVEADLARRLAAELGRPVQFIELVWNKQIPSLLDQKTDIIMSGMSITGTRKVRINFTDQYLKSGLVSLMRVEDEQKYNSTEKIVNSSSNLGVVAGTTSDIFVRKNFPNIYNIIALQKPEDAPAALDRRSIDIFVHDVPSIMWLVSENEADLAAFWHLLNEESLAWGVRRDDDELLMKVNSILDKWKSDGTLKQILLKWLPSKYLERFK